MKFFFTFVFLFLTVTNPVFSQSNNNIQNTIDIGSNRELFVDYYNNHRYRYFSEHDLIAIKAIKSYLDQGFTLKAAVKKAAENSSGKAGDKDA